jgi:serine/threonine-protein kinase RsbW
VVSAQATAPAAAPGFKLAWLASHAGLADAQGRIEHHLRAQGVGDKPLRRLLLVVEEAVMNIEMHGGGARQVRLAIALQPDEIVVTIEDDGPCFDPCAAPQPTRPDSLSEARQGGLGVHLMRTFARAMHHEWRDGCNILTLALARQ